MLTFLIWSCAPKTGQLNYVKRCNRNKTGNRFQDKTFRMASFDNFETNLATQLFFILEAVSGFISVTVLFTILSAHFISTSSATGYNGNFYEILVLTVAFKISCGQHFNKKERQTSLPLNLFETEKLGKPKSPN